MRYGVSAGVATALALGACGPQKPEPDNSYEITVTGTTNTCTTDTSGYREVYQYDLYYDGAAVEIDVDDVPMATGSISGCKIEYVTSTWLEDRPNDTYLRWAMEGSAKFQGLAGGCVDDPYDWDGTETITVTESSDPDVPVDCTYTMTAQGTLVQ